MPVRTIVTTDGSESSRKIEEFVLHLSRTISLHVLLVHALDLRTIEYKMIPDFQVEMIRQGAQRAAEKLIEKEKSLFEQSGVPVESRLLTGAAGPAICDFAKQEEVSLVIIGRRGQSDLHDLLFGSVSNYVLHHCRVPVLVVKRRGPFPSEEEASRPLRVLVPVDGSEATRRCIDWLTSCNEYCKGMDLTLLHVVYPNRPGIEHLPAASRKEALAGIQRGEEDLLETAANRLRAHGFSVSTRIEGGMASKMICSVYSEEKFDLILMGRRGFSELTELILGSVSHFVVHHCLGHVLIVP